MGGIRFHDVRLAYDGHAPILDGVELQLGTGWTGLVGESGAGKTTLLRAAIGELPIAGGLVVREPPDGTVRLCVQRVDEPGPDVLGLAAASDRHALRWQRRLALDPVQVERWQTLSAGERKRWQLAGALAAAPDVLGLDEPTSHIDAATRATLVAELRRFRGVGLLVSHDRELLDELCHTTIHVAGGGVTSYPGGYSSARASMEGEPPARRWLATLDGVTLRAGAHLVARDVHVAVARDSRVHVRGANGAGKSTLLAALVAAVTIPRERLLWLPQELEPSTGEALVADLQALPAVERGRAEIIAVALGLDPSRLLGSGPRSPGELRKLAIARGLARPVWLVVLDEPTAHLDLPSIERLRTTLAAYPGALVLATHDARFAGALTTTTWRLGDGAVVDQR